MHIFFFAGSFSPLVTHCSNEEVHFYENGESSVQFVYNTIYFLRNKNEKLLQTNDFIFSVNGSFN